MVKNIPEIKNRNIFFAAACAGLLFFGMAVTLLGSVSKPLAQKYSLSDRELGLLFAILPLGILVGSFLFGPLCDKFGYRIVLAVSCISIFVGFEAIAYSPSILFLFTGIFIFGSGGGAINGAGSALVSEIYDEHRASHLNLLGVFFGLGALSIPFILASAQQFPFEKIVAVLGFLVFALGLLFLFIAFPHHNTAEISIGAIKKLLHEKILIIVAVFLLFQGSVEALINNWLPTFLNTHAGFPYQLSLYALVVFVAGMTSARFLLGTLFKNWNSRRVWQISFLCSAIAFTLLATTSNRFVLFPAVFLLGYGLGGGFPLMFSVVGFRFPVLSATAFSIVLGISLSGNILLNYFTGWLVQQVGAIGVLWVCIPAFVVMVILCIRILSVKQLK